MKNTLLCFLLASSVGARAQTNAPASQSADDKSVYIVVLQQGDDKPFDAGAGSTQLARQGRKIALRIPDPAAEGLRHNPRVRYIQRAVLGNAPRVTTAAFSMKAESSAVRTPQTDTGSSWTTGTYTYDGDGNIWSIGQDRFTYDGAERLVTSTVYSGGTAHAESFTYDPYGNLTGKTTDGTSTSYAVSAATNQYIAPMSVSYDNVGNVAIDSLGAQYDYDAAGMVKSKGMEVYIYSADDERIAVSAGIVASEGWRWTVREANQTVAREYESFGGPEGSDYFVWIEDHAYAGTKMVSSERESTEGGRRHFHVDHLGTPRFMTNDSAQILSEHTYRPYGVEITSGDQERTRGYERDEPMRFTGHERDGVNNSLNPGVGYVDYMHARYYNPFWGRFLSVDPGQSAVPGEPQTWNRYTYGLNNPVKHVDPDGRYVAVGADLRSAISAAYANSPTFRGWFDSVHRDRSILQKMVLGPVRAPGARAQTNEDRNSGSVMVRNGAIYRDPSGQPVTSIRLTTIIPAGHPQNIGKLGGHELQHGVEYQTYGSPANAPDARPSTGGIETDTALAVEEQIKNELVVSGMKNKLTKEEEENLFDVDEGCTGDIKKCPKLEPRVDPGASTSKRPPE